MKSSIFNSYKSAFTLNKGLAITRFILLAIGMLALLPACKKSFKNGVIFTIGTSGFKYTALVQVRDASNNNIAPGNLAVHISGPDASYIYDLSTGKRALKINPDGTVQLLIAPNRLPGNAVSFNISVSSPGYLPVVKPITITSADSSQVIKIALNTITSGKPGGSTAAVAQFALKNGAMASQGVIKLSAGNAIKVTQGPPSYADVESTTDAVRKKLASVDGSTPGSQVSYYDDGLTSVVLPKGTTFHYWALDTTKIVTVTDSMQVPHTTAKSVGVSGVAVGSLTEYETYYTQEAVTYSYAQTAWVQKAADPDSIAVVVDYGPGASINTKAEITDPNQPVPSIHTLNNQTVLKDELLFNTAVSEKLYGNPVFYQIHHSTKKSWYDYATHTVHTNETVPAYIVYDRVVDPDQTANWFTSFVINPNFTNPVTGATIAAGDSVEIGIDPTTSNTIRQAVEKVNGQLRVQILSYDAGFFYQAPNKESFSYTITPFCSTADPENATGEINVLGTFYFGFSGANYSTPFTIQGKIASSNTLTTTTTAAAAYWGTQVFSQSYGLQGAINPFGFSPPNPIATFNILASDNNSGISDIEVDAQPKNGKTYGAVTAYVNFTTSSGGSGVVNIRNGYWATNEFAAGSTISGGGYVDGYLFTLKSYTVLRANPMYWDAPFKL